MDLWNKMLTNIIDTVFLNDMDDNTLIDQIHTALQESNELLKNESEFIDPCFLQAFQEKWESAYYTAKEKTKNISCIITKSGRKLRHVALQFIELYEQFPLKLKAHNEHVAGKKIALASELILPVEGQKLDEQQMLCIVKEAKNHLVLAGAGTGKTTTIVGCVKYLIKKEICSASDILVLSFTNASATEMNQRLKAEIGMSITASTFHKLGIDIISSVQGKRPNVFSSDIRQFVRQELDGLMRDVNYLRKLCLYLTYYGSEQKSEFDFKTNNEYQAYLKYNPPITLKGEKVKSYGELDIANFLTQNGISYVYEKAYPVDTRNSEYAQYHPDFYLPDYQVYIEYFGINRNGEVPSFFTGKDGQTPSQTYQSGIRWKRELHRKYGTCMVEVYAYEKFEEKLLQCLEERLKKVGVVFHPLTVNEIWSGIGGTEKQKLDRIAELFGTVITLIKSNNCSLDEIRMRNHRFQNLPSIDLVLDLINPIYESYQEKLRINNEIDFNDMINLASEYTQSGKFEHTYKYVIIDEYQDISQSRYRLLDSMRKQQDFKIFCVGDDWQSIYRFSGSDIGFILNFEKYWGASEISRIETTYRFSKSLISVSSNFIMKNTEQKCKQLRSAAANNRFAIEQIKGYTEKNAVDCLVERLKELPQNSTIFFIGRYRFDIKICDTCSQLSYRYNTVQGRTEVKFAKRPDLHISFLTAHSAKGLQADYVFILNNKAYGMGFPSKIADAPVLQLLLDNCDHYPFAEERRLFYVAITRARKKVWLITIRGNESVFVKELEETYGDAMRREQYTCPLCGGYLVKRNSSYGEFYGCSNYKNGCRFIRNIVK